MTAETSTAYILLECQLGQTRPNDVPCKHITAVLHTPSCCICERTWPQRVSALRHVDPEWIEPFSPHSHAAKKARLRKSEIEQECTAVNLVEGG